MIHALILAKRFICERISFLIHQIYGHCPTSEREPLDATQPFYADFGVANKSSNR